MTITAYDTCDRLFLQLTLNPEAEHQLYAEAEVASEKYQKYILSYSLIAF